MEGNMFHNRKIIVRVLVCLVLVVCTVSVVGCSKSNSSKKQTEHTSKVSKKKLQEAISNIQESHPLTFEGFNGLGSASLPTITDDDDEKIDVYDVDESQKLTDLSNGDEISVTITAMFAQNYGIPELEGKKIIFKVENLKNADILKTVKETRDAVINSRGEHGVTQDKVFYNVLTDKEGQAYLTVDVFTHFTFNNDVLGENLVLNSSPSEKFEKGDTVYYRSTTKYMLDEDGNPTGPIFSDDGTQRTKITSDYSKKPFDTNVKGYKEYKD